MAEHAATVAHQFGDAKQQAEAVTFGMWVFLLTEMMFFGTLFIGYTIYRLAYPAAFVAGSRHLDIGLGSINTAVLIGSSLSMVLAAHAARADRRQKLIGFLLATILLGVVFLVIKGVEYAHKFEANLVPGMGFRFDGSNADQAQLFLAFYFAMTGIHALHLVVGIGILTVLLCMAWRGRFSAVYNWPVETCGLYWHFVDIVWIFLFPLLYLLGRHA